MIQQTMDFISQFDPEVGASIREEFARQRRNIELIASENIVSPAVMLAMGTCLTNKYAEGYPGKRYYGCLLYTSCSSAPCAPRRGLDPFPARSPKFSSVRRTCYVRKQDEVGGDRSSV